MTSLICLLVGCQFIKQLPGTWWVSFQLVKDEYTGNDHARCWRCGRTQAIKAYMEAAK